MNYENMLIGSLMGKRVAVINIPAENRDEIIDAFRKKAAHTVAEPVKDRKELFKILSQYKDRGQVVVFVNQDAVLKKRQNSKYNDIFNYLTNDMYDPAKPLKLEGTMATWALDYDSFKIPGFTDYHGKMLFITDLDENSINEKIVSRHCFVPESRIVFFGEEEETIDNKGY